MALWCKYSIKALNGHRLIIRRAFMWYVLLLQLNFRDPRKSSIKINETIIMRCATFLGGDFGALLNERKPEDERARIKQAAHEILAVKPHCIRRGAARILGHGMGSCDTTTTNDQMLAKHPRQKSNEA
jgi:hypothetical protein